MLLLIAPYTGLKEVALSVIEENGYSDIDVYVGNYQKAPEILRRVNADSRYGAVITRGGTAAVCRAITRLPVIEIRITAFDMLRVLKLTEGYQGKKAFLASENLAEEFERMGRLLESDVTTFCYHEHAQVEGMILKLKEEGYELVVGDHIVYSCASGHGLNSLLLTSGPEGVRDAVEETLRLCSYLREAGLQEGYKEGKEPVSLSVPADSVPAASVPIASVPETEGKGRLPKAWQESLQYLIIKDMEEMSFDDVHTVFPKSQADMIKDYSQTPFPTTICGLDGTCKDDAGYLCCCYSRRKKGTFVRMDTNSVPDSQDFKALGDLLEDLFQKEGGILFLEDIDTMSHIGQKGLVRVLRRLERNKEIKLMASCEPAIDACEAGKTVIRPLLSILDEVRIDLKPLHCFSREITNMVSICLGKMDMSGGNYTAGMEQAGLRLLEEYEWPGNLRQFMRVMNHLALSRNGIFIREKDVRRVLKEEAAWEGTQVMPIDLSGSLEEIEKRVIGQVMALEGMNQSRVEKRLGIGHSTLWRKLNQEHKNVSK